MDKHAQAQAMVQNYAGKMMQEMVGREEQHVDEMMKKLDEMDEDDIEKMRDIRRKRLIAKQDQLRLLRQQGHGEYMEIGEKQFFSEIQKPPTAIVHLYRGSTIRCEIFDMHMARAAKEYVECRFVKVNAEKSPFICERLNIWALPSLVLIKAGKVHHTCVGFNDFGDKDDFSHEVFTYVLGNNLGMFKFKGEVPKEFDADAGRLKKGKYMKRLQGRADQKDSESDDTDMSD